MLTGHSRTVVPAELLEDTPLDVYQQLKHSMVGQLKDELFGKTHASIAVIVPYRETPDRAPLMHWVVNRLHRARQYWPGWGGASIILATDDPHGKTPWCKARAAANGIAHAAADILVIHDADVFTNGLRTAVEMVLSGRGQWAIPHDLVHRLKPGPTTRVLEGAPVRYERALCERKPYRGWEGGGIVVLTRDAWNTAPLDPRFRGWGQEDESWALALRTLAGPPWRGTSPLVHLWHEPLPRICHEYGSRESKWLADRYKDAASANDAGAAMRKLIADGRHC